VEIDPKSPKTIAGVVAAIAAAVAGGSFLGFTIEPEGTTKLRIEKATLEERAGNLETQLGEIKGRVDTLEGLAEDCRLVISNSRKAIEE